MSEDRQRADRDGRAFAGELLKRVDAMVRSNSIVVQQQAAMLEQSRIQQVALSEQLQQNRVLSERVLVLSEQVSCLAEEIEVLSRARIGDEGYMRRSVDAAAGSAGRQIAGQVLNGLVGVFKPPVPPHGRVNGHYRPVGQQPWMRR